MSPKKTLIIRLLVPLTAMVVGSACIVETAMGPTSTPQIIVIPGDGGADEQNPAASSPTPETILDLTPTGTLTPQPTNTASIAPVTMTAGQDLSCVKGPHWILYDWVTKIAEGESVTLLAKAEPEWQDYYYVRTAAGTECWAFGGSSTISGDAAGLPIRETPPLPEIEYVIENKIGMVIPVIYIREKDSTAWGVNRLSAPLVPGATFSLTLTAGFYDVKILDPLSGVLYEEHDRAIGSDPNYRYTAVATEVEFYIQNNHPFTICVVSIRPAGGSTWTVVRSAADGAVGTGERVTLKLLVGVYDINVYRCSGPIATNLLMKYVGPTIPGFNIP
jgi:hypothetical protein